jgi:hypothetical protein
MFMIFDIMKVRNTISNGRLGMKKLVLLVVFMLSFSVFSCEKSNSGSSKTLLEATTIYKDKVSSILENKETKTKRGRFYNDTPYNEADMLPRETYLSVYENLVDNSNDVVLTPYLLTYKNLLDELYNSLEDLDVSIVEADLSLVFLGGNTIDMHVFVSKDDGVVFEFDYSQTIFQTTITSTYRLKMGYEDDLFYIKQLAYTKNEDRYTYFEFLENTSIIDMTYRDEANFNYKYVNQTTAEFFQTSRMSDGYNEPYSHLMWFNPKTMVRTIYADGVEPIRHITVFNEKSMIFSYSDYLDGKISLWFQLLEATGWDHAYLDANAHRNQGVYSNGVMLFKEDEYRQFNVDLVPSINFANVSVTLDFDQDELSDDILNLSRYQMNFYEGKITKSFVMDTINHSYEESKHLAVYRGIDFYSGNVRSEFINQMDKDIKITE